MSSHFLTGENTDFNSAELKTALGSQNVSTNSYIPANIYNLQKNSKNLIYIYVYI